MKKYLLLLLLIALVILQKANAQTPVAYYPFTGNANDAAGANNGTVNGATLTTDRFGNANSAYSFDGVNDNIIFSAPWTTATDNFSIVAWIKRTNGYTVLCNGQNSFNVGGPDNGYAIKCLTVVNFDLCGIGGPTSPANSFTSGVWQHVAVVRESGICKIYINGVFQPATSANAPNVPAVRAIIGSLNLANDFFEGSVDEVKIFNTALTAAQVHSEYNQNNFGGQFNNSVRMNGTNDYIDCGNNAAYNITASLTVEAWVKPTSFGLLRQIIQKGGTAGNEDREGYQLRIDGGSGCGFSVFNGTSQDGAGFSISNNDLNKWMHIAGVYDGSTIKIYRNGVLMSSVNTTQTITHNSRPFLIGKRNDGFPFDGNLDEIRLWNTARTQAQIVASMNSQLTGSETGLVGYWDMNRNGLGAGLTVDNKATATGAALNGITVGTVITPVFELGVVPSPNYSGQFNNSVKMNGANDQIELGSTYNQQIFSVEMWVKPGATQVQYANIIDNNHSGTINWVCQQDASNLNNYGFGVNTNGVSGGVVFQLQSNVWQHVAMIKNATVVQVFVNGVLIQSSPISGSINYSAPFLRLGNFAGGGRHWNGTMDDVRFWDIALTQSQIVANMNSQLVGNESGLVAYWDMNRNGQGAGLTVDNKCVATGAALNGTTVGTASTPIFAPAVTQQKPGSGNAISFDGVDDFITVPHSASLTPSAVSVEAWVKINAYSSIKSGGNTVAQYIVFKPRSNGGSFEGYSLLFNDVTKKFLVTVASASATQVTIESNGIINLNTFYHVVITANSTELKMYVNGILQSTAPTGFSLSYNADPLQIGQSGYPIFDGKLNGVLDEIRIWNTALTQSQIRDHMCRKITSSDALYPNLVAYYNFDESNGNTAFDGTANTNSGTLTNSPTRVTSGAAIGNASSHDYVNATKTTSLTHPTGESFTVTSTSGNPDGIHVYRVDEKPNTLAGASGVGANDKYFGVFQVGGSSPQYTAVYNYSGNPTINAGNESQLRLNKRSDNTAASWTTMVAIPDEPANTITVTGESTEYILGKLGNPLPLNLISFSGSKQNNDALLQWKTANEINVSRFEVQRSDNGQTFTTIGTVAAGGTTYSLHDPNVFNTKSVAFYRLKSIDIDGRFTYSNIIKLSKQASGLITVFPNPVHDMLTIAGLKQGSSIRLFSAEGKLLHQQTVSAQTITINMSGYAKGIYLLQYQSEKEVVNQKIIKQ